MQQWDSAQAQFARALLDPASATPSQVVGDDARFSVYRNNIVVGLLDALRDRFPVTCAIVGEDFFRAMARLFVTRHLPGSALMMFYGDELPEFIASFEPARSVPYLADVASFEAAWTRAYHAADAYALDASALQSIDVATLASSTVRLHPSVQLIRSAYPIATVWAAHQEGEPSGIDLRCAEDVVIIRPASEVIVHRLSRAAFAFVDALNRGNSVENSAAAALGEQTDFDAGVHLVALFAMGAIIGIDPA